MNIPSFPSLLGAALLAGALGLTGCRTTVNTVERAEPVGQKEMVVDKRVLTDASLARKVYVVGVNEGATPGGVQQVQVEVWNRTRSRQKFIYQVEWFDGSGMKVSSTTPAHYPRTIEGLETIHLQSVAPTAACKDFRFKFIEN